MKYILLITTYVFAFVFSYAGTFQVSSSNVDFESNGAIQRNTGIDAGFDSDNGLTFINLVIRY